MLFDICYILFGNNLLGVIRFKKSGSTILKQLLPVPFIDFQTKKY
jgi:hypothetical protein